MAVVGVESPGASNLFLIPFELDGQAQLQGGMLSLRSALELSTNRGIRLSQSIGPEHPSKWDAVLRESGFTRLTHLIYLTRKVANMPSKSGRFQLACGQRWLTYSAQTESLFCEAIAQSYVQSLDCPELTNVRTARESLSAHRAVGEFNPASWFVLVAGDQPQAVLLLSKVRRESVMEIVYMGVSQLARRSGVADLLMDQALRAAASHASNLILAVDVRNTPAIRLYTRWRFVEIARRVAWIASPYSIER